LDDVLHEGQGLLQFAVLQPADIVRLTAAALSGNDEHRLR
jgi:hypothetical protein